MKRSPLFRLICSAERWPARPRTLDEVRPGSMARITRFSVAPAGWQERLLAHGVAPGCVVRVAQHQPVTIIQIDHTELGFERDLARAIEVETV
jgi:Fe2+ transport system protein FeoA